MKKDKGYCYFMYILCIAGFVVCFRANIFGSDMYFLLRIFCLASCLFYIFGARMYKKSYTELIKKENEKRTRSRKNENRPENSFYPYIRRSV